MEPQAHNALTRDAKLLAKVKQLSTMYVRGENTKLKEKLKKMTSLRDNWKETALRREAEIKELKEKIKWMEKNR